MDVTAQLAAHLSAMRYGDLPERVRTKTRLALLDTLGAIWGGAAYASSPRMVRDMVVAMGEGGTATVMGFGRRVQPPWAALCNGVSAHALDVDDSHRFATGYHPGATVIPACLAVAEQVNAPLEDLVGAIATGYEAGGRIGRAINPSHRYRGFHSTGTVGVFGAAAGAGKLLGFDPTEMEHVIGIAGAMAGGVFQFLSGLAPTKHLHAGHAAHAGVMAALLVRSGFRGPGQFLEGDEGFCKAYADEYRIQQITEGLGDLWEMDASYFKPYAACGHTFGAVEAALNLRAKGIEPTDVLRLEVRTYRAGAVLRDQNPRTFHQGEFSLPFLVALAMVKGEVSVESVLAGLKDSAVMDLCRRSDCTEDPLMTESFPRLRAASVHAWLKDGSVVAELVEIPRGMPEVPLTAIEIETKFAMLATPVIGGEAVDAVRMAITSGEGSLGDFMSVPLLLRREIA